MIGEDMNMDQFHDSIAMEIDRRKIQKALDEGKITHEDLANAQRVMIKPQCQCNQGLVSAAELEGMPHCPKCKTPGLEVKDWNEF